MVALGREHGQREVVSDEVLHEVGILGRQTHPLHISAGDRCTDGWMFRAYPGDLADVMKQTCQEQQIRAFHASQVA